MRIDIAGRNIEITGDPSDAYFASAAEQAHTMAALIDKLHLAPKNTAVFDVGANIGLSTLAMAIARPALQIYSFEPSPANVDFLRANVAEFPNVKVIAAAVSNRPGTLKFHASAFAAGSHVVGENHISPNTPTVDVPAISLDDFVAEHHVSPSFIKIDVEGHEPEVLAGARTLFSTANPWIYLEFNSWTLNAFAGHSPASFANALFTSFDVEGWSDPLSFLHNNLVERRCITDIVARLKPGVSMPSLSSMSYPASARAG